MFKIQKWIVFGCCLVTGIGGFLALSLQHRNTASAAPIQTATAAPNLLPLTSGGVAGAVASPLHSPSSLAATLTLAQNTLHISHRIVADTAPTQAQELAVSGSEDRVPTWTVDNERLQIPEFQLHDDIREYEVVKLDQTPSLPEAGDWVTIPMLNGTSVVVAVKSTKVNRNGDFIWKGHLQGYGNDYPVVMTYGKDATFAMITTPDGSYSMESINGVGWLYKNPAENELTLPGHEDFLEIPDSTPLVNNTSEEDPTQQ